MISPKVIAAQSRDVRPLDASKTRTSAKAPATLEALSCIHKNSYGWLVISMQTAQASVAFSLRARGILIRRRRSHAAGRRDSASAERG
jgi:hypothetical protein